MEDIKEQTADRMTTNMGDSSTKHMAIPIASADKTSPFKDEFMVALQPHLGAKSLGDQPARPTRMVNIRAEILGNESTLNTQAAQTYPQSPTPDSLNNEDKVVTGTPKAEQDMETEKAIDMTPWLTIQFLDDPSENEQYGYKRPVRPYLASTDHWEDDLYEPAKKKLSKKDRQKFAELDEELEKLWEMVIDAGFTLAYIKKFELYREKYPTFAAYCEDRFGMKHIPHEDIVDLVTSRAF